MLTGLASHVDDGALDFWENIEANVQPHVGSALVNEFRTDLDTSIEAAISLGTYPNQASGPGSSLFDLRESLKADWHISAPAAESTYRIPTALEQTWINTKSVFGTVLGQTLSDPTVQFTGLTTAASCGVSAFVPFVTPFCVANGKAFGLAVGKAVAETIVFDIGKQAIDNTDFSNETKSFVKKAIDTAKVGVDSYDTVSDFRNLSYNYNRILEAPDMLAKVYSAGELATEVRSRVRSGKDAYTEFFRTTDGLSQTILDYALQDHYSSAYSRSVANAAIVTMDERPLSSAEKESLAAIFHDRDVLIQHVGLTPNDANRLLTAVLPSYTFFDFDGERLLVRGTQFADYIDVGPDSSTPANVAVMVNGVQVTSIPRHQTLRIDVYAKGGDDHVSVREAIPTSVAGGAGNDYIVGSFVEDVLQGGPGDDILIGRDGDDVLYGGTGDDELVGGAGVNMLSGGSGKNTMIDNHQLITLSDAAANHQVGPSSAGTVPSLVNVDVTNPTIPLNGVTTLTPVGASIAGGNIARFEVWEVGAGGRLLDFDDTFSDGFTVTLTGGELGGIGSRQVIARIVGQNGVKSTFVSKVISIVAPDSGLGVVSNFATESPSIRRGQSLRGSVNVSNTVASVGLFLDLNRNGVADPAERVETILVPNNLRFELSSESLPVGTFQLIATGFTLDGVPTNSLSRALMVEESDSLGVPLGPKVTKNGTTVTIMATEGNDVLEIAGGQVLLNSQVVADYTTAAFTPPGAGISRFIVLGGKGGGRFDFRGSLVPITFVGGNGDDEVYGSDFNDVIYGGGGTDFIRGGDGADDLFAVAGTGNVIHGGPGDDRIDGSSGGDDFLNGGAGADTFIVFGNDVVQDQTAEDTVEGLSERLAARRRNRIDQRINDLRNFATSAAVPVRVSAAATPEITNFTIDKNIVTEGESVVFTVRAAADNWARLELFVDANNDGILDNNEDVIGRFRGRNRDWRGQLGTANLSVGVHNIRARLLPFVGNIAVSSAIQLSVQPELIIPEPPPLPDHLNIAPDEVLILLPNGNGDGLVRNNSLAGAGQIDIWEITPRTGGGFNFWTEGTTDTAVALYDANGNIIGSPDTNNGPGENGAILVTLAADTKYFVVVTTETNGGDYDFVFTGRNQTTEGDITLTPVTHVGSATRSFAGNHRLNFHSVLSPPDATRLDVDLQLDAGLEVIVRVADANNNVIGFYSPSDNILQNLPAEPNTLYYITVYGLYGTNGEYTVAADFYPDDPGFPTDLSPTPAVDDWLIPLNDGRLTVPGLSIEDGGEIDFYLVTPTTTGQYIFETTGSLDTRIGIYQRFSASNAALMSFNEDDGNGLNARLAIDLTAGNDLLLAVRSGNDETGNYSLLTSGPSPSIGVLQPQGLEAIATSSTHFIANNTHWQMFEVTVPTFANKLDFLLEYRASSNPAFNLDASVRITDENGSMIASVDNAGARSDEFINNLAVAPGARLYITVAGEDFTIGDYRLHLDFNPNFPVSAGTEFPVSTNNWHEWPNVARNAAGNGVMVWNTELYINGFSHDEIHALLIGPDGQPVGSEFRVDTSSGFDFSKPVVAVAPDGSFVVAWENHFRRFSANGTALTGEVDFAPAGESPGYQSIAAAPDGSFVVVWSSFSAGDPNGDIYAQRISASGAKTGPQILVNSVNVDYQSEPDVAFLSNGEWVVTWTSDLNGPTSTEIRSRSYTAGTPVTNEAMVNTTLAGYQSGPRIAASADGHGYVIIWRDSGQFRGQRFTNGHQLVGSEFAINTTTSGTTVFEEPDVAFGAEGKFVVSYSISDGNGRGVAVQKFNATGKSGPELILNQLKSADQDTIAIASSSNDKVLAVWRSTADYQSHIRGIEFSIAEIPEPEITVLDSEGPSGDLKVDFDQFATGGNLASHFVTIINDGNSDLVISGISIQGADAGRFILDDSSDFTLVGGTSKNLTISFDPATQGNFEARLTFSHNDNSDISSGDVDPNPLSVALLARVVSPQRLEVTVLPSTLVESAGSGAGVVLVTRRNAVSIDQPLAVTLSSDDPTEATVAASAVIPAGELSVIVQLDVIDDEAVDGDQIVLISATADGFLAGQGTVTVRDDNNAPIDISLSANSVAENVAGATIGTVTVTDPDLVDTHTFVLSDHRFEIVDAVLKLKAGQSLDFEASESINLDITARDAGGLPFSKSFAININNQPEGTIGSDAFVLTYSASSVAIAIGANSLGVFPLSAPLTLFGLGGTDSVKIVGTTGSDVIAVSSTGIVVNGSTLILNSIESLLLVGGAGNDTYRFDTDNALGLISLDEAGGGNDTLDFSATDTLGIAINLAVATTQVVNANLSLNLKSGSTFDNVIGGAINDSITGNALANILRGGSGNDVLLGSGGNDLLEGGAGNDTQDGGAGNDTYLYDVDTNQGTETLTDASGTDTVSFAGSTANVTFSLGLTTPQSVNATVLTISSATAFDNLIGGDGNDTLTGNAGANTLIGGAGNDTLAGAAGNDIYLFEADTPLGSDTLIDAVGTETISFSGTSTNVAVNLGLTTPQIVNSSLTLTLASATTFDHLIGGDGNDTLTGNSGANTLSGGAGNDLLAGGAGNDTYLFDADLVLGSDTIDEAVGAGTDLVSFTLTTTTAVTMSLGTLSSQVVVPGKLSVTLLSDAAIENITSGTLGGTFTGNSLANTLTGGSGSDTLNGMGGNDTLTGGAGNDTLIGGAGNDLYVFDADAAVGTDTIDESAGGVDTLDFTSTTTKALVIDLSLATLQIVHLNHSLILGSGTTIENVKGGSLGDVLTGNSLANALTGNAGNDILNGGDGDDLLIGNAGNDVLNGGLHNDVYQFDVDVLLGSDTINDPSGVDALDFALTTTVGITLDLAVTSVQALHATNLSLTLPLGTMIETVLGTAKNDIVFGNDADNILIGNAGNDVLHGRAGRDILVGGLGADTLDGGADDDILIGGKTTNDAVISKLNDLHAEWISANLYTTRITNLRAGVGPSVASLKAKVTVTNDATSGSADTITGGTGEDWFFKAFDDVITDLLAGETLDLL